MEKQPSLLPHLSTLFLAGLGLRLTYYFIAVGNVGFEQFWQIAPDTRLYWGAATQIAAGETLKMCEILWVGPGYIATLAGLQTLFGANPLCPILLNILLGSLAPVFVYLIGYNLSESRAVALISGIISAVSLTSVALSSMILTDQPAFTYFAACLAAYTYAFRKGSRKWFVIAALMGSLSALTRPAAQFWAYIFLFLPAILPLQPGFDSRLKMWMRAVTTGLIMAVVVLGWSTCNYVTQDAFVFATSGTLVARLSLLPQVISQHTPGTNIIELRTQMGIEDGHGTDSCNLEHIKAGKHVSEMFRAHPVWMTSAILGNIRDNIKASNDIFYAQIPQLTWFSGPLNRSMNMWLGYAIVAISLLGLGFLIIDRNHLAWMLLGGGYAFFTLITGFSYWQGSRLHYQAEMFWAVLFAYAVHRVFMRRKPAV